MDCFEYGSTEPGRGWNLYKFGVNALYIDVNTTKGHFTETPIYITSLGGLEGHGKVSGVTAIYKATATGFRVYVTSPYGKYLTITDGAAGRWFVNWVGIDKKCKNPDHVDWGTSNLWTHTGMYLKNDIMTTKGNFLKTPMYLTSMTGTAQMYDLVGTSAIYDASLDHFAIWLHPKMSSKMGISTQTARRYHYAIDWVGLGQIHIERMRFGWTDAWEDTSGGKGIHVHVKFYKPFAKKARCFTALQGSADGHMFATVGSTSVFNETAYGCTVYVHFVPGYRFAKVNAKMARKWGWTLEYLGIAKEKEEGKEYEAHQRGLPTRSNQGDLHDAGR
jgi:hypothetical protein